MLYRIYLILDNKTFSNTLYATEQFININQPQDELSVAEQLYEEGYASADIEVKVCESEIKGFTNNKHTMTLKRKGG